MFCVGNVLLQYQSVPFVGFKLQELSEFFVHSIYTGLISLLTMFLSSIWQWWLTSFLKAFLQEFDQIEISQPHVDSCVNHVIETQIYGCFYCFSRVLVLHMTKQ